MMLDRLAMLAIVLGVTAALIYRAAWLIGRVLKLFMVFYG